VGATPYVYWWAVSKIKNAADAEKKGRGHWKFKYGKKKKSWYIKKQTPAGLGPARPERIGHQTPVRIGAKEQRSVRAEVVDVLSRDLVRAKCRSGCSRGTIL